MEVKVILFVYVCCLQLLMHQHYPFLVNGESIKNATSSMPEASSKNGTDITITNYQTKNTPNVTKAQLQEVVIGTTNNGSAENVLSRKITKTENGPIPALAENITKGNTIASGSKTTTKLTMVAPNVMIDMNVLKSNGTVPVKLNQTTNSDGITKVSNQSNMQEAAFVNATVPTNAGNLNNKTISTPTAKADRNAIATNNTMDVRSTNSSVINETSSTTTTTTTPKPKKPTITLGLGDFPHLPGEPIPTKKPTDSKLPVPSDNVAPPNAQPSQELNSGFNYHTSRDFIVPIMTILFTIPLAIGVLITTYRRFRDCWSTRHYRRMDFLVDGMYND